MLAETPDSTIEELRRLLAGLGLDFGYGTIQRFLIRHRMTREKKTGYAYVRRQPCPEAPVPSAAPGRRLSVAVRNHAIMVLVRGLA